jgi:hypothetical protein
MANDVKTMQRACCVVADTEREVKSECGEIRKVREGNNPELPCG